MMLDNDNDNKTNTGEPEFASRLRLFEPVFFHTRSFKVNFFFSLFAFELAFALFAWRRKTKEIEWAESIANGPLLLSTRN